MYKTCIKIQTLKDLCRTRWIEKIDALDKIKKLHSSIVVWFESISVEGSRLWSPDSVTDASTFLLAITSTEFVSAFVITHGCLQCLRGASLLAFKRKPKTLSTTSLQEEAKDIVQAVSEIKTLTSSLKQVSESVDSYHSRWFETISEMCIEVGIALLIPRICGWQYHRARTPASNPSECYRRTITVLILVHLLAELVRRFSSHQNTSLQGLYLVPSILVIEDLSTVSRVVMKEGVICCRPPKHDFSQ